MNKIKDIELKQMKDLNNWKEITRGLYRFVVGTSACYEIHIKIYEHNTPVLMANASSVSYTHLTLPTNSLV